MSNDNTMTGSSGSVDPVALLGSIAAPAGWNQRTETVGPHADQQAARTLAGIISGSALPVKRRRNGLRLVTSIVVAISLGGAAVAAVLWERSPEQISTVSCWSDSANPPALQVGVAWDGRTSPAEQCASAWAGGELGGDGPPSRLQACVTSAGTTAVVPGDDATCGSLGLARFVDPATADDRDELFTIAQLEQRLLDQFNLGQCATPDTAAATSADVIAELGLDQAGWTVEVLNTFSAEEPCATVAVDGSVDTVFIVPAGPNG